ncbi:MAG: VTT domain-containing protein [Chitinispirillia bacterium]
MQKKSNLKTFISIIIFLIPGTVIGLLLIYLATKFEINVIQNFIILNGFNSVVLFIFLFTLRTFLVVAPYYMMIIIGGILFGPKLGLLLNIISALISASVAFSISRYIKFTALFKSFTNKKWETGNTIEKNGFKIIILLRLALIFPFDIINYSVGLTKIKYRDFLLGNLLGIIPEVLFLTLFGTLLLKPNTIQFYIFLFSLVNISIILIVYKNQIKRSIKKLIKNNNIINISDSSKS